MLTLTGKNLGERQQQLNKKVNDAAKDKIDFNIVKKQDEKSDVDKFFKIDLAAKFRNLEYILEIFMFGDYLYISRALDKCSWLYEDDFKHIINVNYLCKYIFPSMSIKMRNKMLTAIATNMKNNDIRAIEFFAYCMKVKLYNIALKHLIHTPQSFKLDVITKKTKAFELISQKESDYLRHFIGDSFDLAENYVKSFDLSWPKSYAIYLLRYMYSLSNEKYLDMFEKCDTSGHVLGRRLSKHIVQNYKSRVIKKPMLYATALNKDIIKRSFKVEEAKIFAVALLPERSISFFGSKFYAINKFVLDIIPPEEKFTFVKQIFSEKYKDEPFETCHEFYSNDFFEMMTIHERESWALQNIANQNEILGSGKDYLWYKFVSFEKAFNQLRKEIMITTDQIKRCEMLKILLDSAKTEDELAKLLNYFCERHRNEMPHVIDRFLNKLINDHKVWRFGENCWNALEKIFYNIEVFDKSKYQSCDSDYRVLALMYYVINKKTVPEVLNEYLEMNAISFYTLKRYIKNLEYEKDMMFQYILQYYTEMIKSIGLTPCEENTKNKMRTYLRSTLDIALFCDKSKDDLPEIVLANIKLDWSEFEHHQLLAIEKLSSIDIKHYLKKDASLVVTQIPQIKKYYESTGGNINWLIQKIRIYFSQDLSEKYLMLFNEYLCAETSYTGIEVAVRGIFMLADSAHKMEFLDKYTPTGKAMDKATTSTHMLDIQKAICRQMLASRPPLPLAKVFLYITGDYVQYCLVLFRSFLVNLPQPQCLEFVQKMINSPVSIQKHGLRLAFESVETDKLQMIILDSWNKTKNVSLRMVLYKQLSMKIADETNEMKLFDILLKLTLDLNEDDDEALKLIDTIKLPNHFIGRYLEVAWNTVSRFSEKPQNFARMVRVIKRIESKIQFVPENCVDKIINDHIHFMFDQEQIVNNKFKPGFDDLLTSKLDLTTSNLAYITNEKKLEKNVEVVKYILKKCIEMWDKRDNSDNKYVVRQYIKSFIADLDGKSYDYDINSISNFITLIQNLEYNFKKSLPEKEIYQLVWNLQSSVVTKKVILSLNVCFKTLKLDDVKDPGIKLGKDFGMLIKTRVEEGTFYRMFCEQIKSIATTAVDDFHRYFRNWDLFSSTDTAVLFCLGLLKHEIFETYELALNILPLDYEGKFMDVYLNTIKKIQAFQSKELQFYVYEKFVNTDFKIRNYFD